MQFPVHLPDRKLIIRAKPASFPGHRQNPVTPHLIHQFHHVLVLRVVVEGVLITSKIISNASLKRWLEGFGPISPLERRTKFGRGACSTFRIRLAMIDEGQHGGQNREKREEGGGKEPRAHEDEKQGPKRASSVVEEG